MAPPRTAKQPGSTAADSHLRQDRNARRQVAEDVDEDDHPEDSAGVDDEAEDDAIEPSQGTAVQSMIIGGLNNQKKRHHVNKKQVKEKYGCTKTEVQNSIATLFDEHEEQADTAHSAQLKRLANLIALKASLESQMTTKLAHLQTMYDTHSRELSDVLDSRIKELKK
ncbi:hypothetical protein E8E11_001522 [Didymella keratinophila]|nr:hypothetical protein E8E11_001522 [Didymella keratinophila]